MANSRKDHRPECRLCGHRHFSSEPHVFAESKEPKKKPVKKVKKKSKSTDVERVQKWRERNREHYNAYQRRYMRKRRAQT